MKTGIVVSILFGVLLLAGCDNQAAKVPAPPKWQGAAYHLSFGPAPAKPNPAGLTIPQIKWDANPDELDTRADLAVQFDSSKAKGAGSGGQITNFMTMAAVSINGAQGALPDDYVNEASTSMAKMLAAYCVKGTVKVSVALTRSSLPTNPSGEQIDAKRLSDWTPIDLDFKNPHPKC